MVSKKWLAHRRNRYNQRKKAKFGASAPSQHAQPPLPKLPAKPKIKITKMTVRERLRLVENTVVWMHQAADREVRRLRARLAHFELHGGRLLDERDEARMRIERLERRCEMVVQGMEEMGKKRRREEGKGR